MKEGLSQEEISRAVEKAFPEQERYPQYIGGGLYRLSENCITGEKGYKRFCQMAKDEIINMFNNGKRERCSMMRIYNKAIDITVKKMDEIPANIPDFQIELIEASRNLISAVERYVEPKKGEHCTRNELLIVKNQLKDLLK